MYFRTAVAFRAQSRLLLCPPYALRRAHLSTTAVRFAKNSDSVNLTSSDLTAETKRSNGETGHRCIFSLTASKNRQNHMQRNKLVQGATMTLLKRTHLSILRPRTRNNNRSKFVKRRNKKSPLLRNELIRRVKVLKVVRWTSRPPKKMYQRTMTNPTRRFPHRVNEESLVCSSRLQITRLKQRGI
jgi:hypothetical protein